jgi:hypothetical protein
MVLGIQRELACTVIATVGAKSFSILIFIFVLLFSKKFADATEPVMKVALIDISSRFR